MKTDSISKMTGPNTADETGGTPEHNNLSVRLLNDEWIVENAVGKSVGSAKGREAAIEIARERAGAEKASAISILGSDGAVERTLKV